MRKISLNQKESQGIKIIFPISDFRNRVQYTCRRICIIRTCIHHVFDTKNTASSIQILPKDSENLVWTEFCVSCLHEMPQDFIMIIMSHLQNKLSQHNTIFVLSSARVTTNEYFRTLPISTPSCSEKWCNIDVA